jgi:hypothetical protein
MMLFTALNKYVQHVFSGFVFHTAAAAQRKYSLSDLLTIFGFLWFVAFTHTETYNPVSVLWGLCFCQLDRKTFNSPLTTEIRLRRLTFGLKN